MTSHEAQLAETGVLNFDWYRTLPERGIHAFWAAFLGWALDAFDFMVFSFSLSAIAAAFSLSQGQSGMIATVTLLVSAFGGMLAGTVADSIGRVRTLMVTVAVYCTFTFLSGMAQSYEQLLVFRALQGLGFGGEWAAGAVLLAEVANPAHRGRVMGFMQSAWAVGWGLSAIAYMLVFSLVPPETGWRVLFWLGILPGLLILYIRAKVPEPTVFTETRRQKDAGTKHVLETGAKDTSLIQIFRPDLLRTTVLASLLATGAQGGYYAIFTWLPTYLKTARKLAVVGTGEYLLVVITGAFIGYLTTGYLTDWLGRRGTFLLNSVVSAVVLVVYTQIPEGANSLLLILGFPLGFFASGIFSGFGSYLAELFPSRARGAGQGFCYNFGRAVGALFPTAVGFLSAVVGFSGAIAFGAVGYALAAATLVMLPETKGKVLKAVD